MIQVLKTDGKKFDIVCANNIHIGDTFQHGYNPITEKPFVYSIDTIIE